jgi:anti-sigma B factor antagonist
MQSYLSQRNSLDAVYRMAKMSRLAKFVRTGVWADRTTIAKIYQNFMMPKAVEFRLCISMQPTEMNWQTWEPAVTAVSFGVQKESKLKLSLETRNRGDVIIVHCQGRIVYRDEAAALSRIVGEALQDGCKLVLDLSGVSAMDSAGIGELALLQTWAQERNANLKCAGANDLVRTLLDLTNLDSVVEVHPSVESALDSFRTERVCADC